MRLVIFFAPAMTAALISYALGPCAGRLAMWLGAACAFAAILGHPQGLFDQRLDKILRIVPVAVPCDGRHIDTEAFLELEHLALLTADDKPADLLLIPEVSAPAAPSRRKSIKRISVEDRFM